MNYGLIEMYSKYNIPGTDTKNFTESLKPCTDNWACAIEQYGVKLLGVISWVFGSEYTFTSLLIGKPNKPSEKNNMFIKIQLYLYSFC